MAEEERSVDSEVGRQFAGKYLTFNLGDEDYAFGILKVQQIIHMQDITAIPRTPEYIAGVINLRGKVIPVVELRRKFEMEQVEYTDDTVIIVVQINRGEDTVIMGVIVDNVKEVLEVEAEDIEKTPAFGASVNTDFILGVAKLDKRVVMLLDIDKILSAEEIEAVATISE